MAALSAVGFALSTSLQHVAAGRAPASTTETHRLLAHLARRPWWVVGQLVAVVSFGLHAFALQLGSLVVVQPVVVSGIVLAVPVRAALARRWPDRRELGTVALTAAGLALFLVSGAPSPGRPPTGSLLPAILTATGVAAAGSASWSAARQRDGDRAAFWFGIASGVLFGLVAGLVKVTTTLAGPTPLGYLSVWSTYVVVLVGLGGVAVNQRAYRVARLSASMPVLNIVDVVIAVGFGVVVFGENLAHDPVAVVGQLVALAMVAVGLRRLGRSTVLGDDEAVLVASSPEAPSTKGSL